jgi:hypothetical protein
MESWLAGADCSTIGIHEQWLVIGVADAANRHRFRAAVV